MDYGQPTQQNTSPEIFSGISSGQGSNDPNINNFEAENNLNTDNWDVIPDRNPSNVGNIAISSANRPQITNQSHTAEQAPVTEDYLPLPSESTPTMPNEVYHPTAESFNPTILPNHDLTPASNRASVQSHDQIQNPAYNQIPSELGQITPIDHPNTRNHSPDAASISDASDFTWSKVMSSDKLTDKAVDSLQSKIRELDSSGDIAAFDDFLSAARENMKGKAI